jgi:hypothetical protein
MQSLFSYHKFGNITFVHICNYAYLLRCKYVNMSFFKYAYM